MAEAAPQFSYSSNPEEIKNDFPKVISVAEMSEDALTSKRAERFIKQAGRAVLRECVEIDTNIQEFNQGSDYNCLMDAIQAASEGDYVARKMIETNVRTDVVERTIKTGHITSVDLELDDSGRIMQFGQTMQNVYANTLKNTPNDSKMQPRNMAEALNGLRLEQLHRQGMLNDYYFVVFSMAADDMNEEELKEAGFFTDTMSVSLQVTSAFGSGLKTETAFVSGKDQNTGDRHDKHTISKIGSKLGVNFGDKSAAEVIAAPLLVHKSCMPNGAIDIVKLYDECAGGTFFGEKRQAQDYLIYKESCYQREQGFQEKVDNITRELICENYSIFEPKDAVRKLHDISERHMVEHAIYDESIDASVFGEIAAAHIEDARIAHREGRFEDAIMYLSIAELTADSSSCPNAANAEEAAPSSLKKRMTCPFCKDPNQYGDPCSPNQFCTNCKAQVVGGKVVSQGGFNWSGGPSLFDIYLEMKAKKLAKEKARAA